MKHRVFQKDQHQSHVHNEYSPEEINLCHEKKVKKIQKTKNCLQQVPLIKTKIFVFQLKLKLKCHVKKSTGPR